MLYYTQEARNSAITNIMELRKKISEIPGNVLSYNDASAIHRYLTMLEDAIHGEGATEEAKVLDKVLKQINK